MNPRDNSKMRNRQDTQSGQNVPNGFAADVGSRCEELRGAYRSRAEDWQCRFEHRHASRWSKSATTAERLLFFVFSFFCQIELGLRYLLGRPFASKFLQRLREASEPVRKMLVDIQSEPGMPESQADGTGEYALTALFIFEDEDFVRDLLQPGMDLKRPDFAPEGKHPLIIGFGLQYGVRPIWRRKHQGMKYLETMIAVPWVELTDSREPVKGPFMCLPRLFLDQLTPTALGWLFGYRKRWMRIATGPQSFKVSTLLRKQPVFEATIHYHDPSNLAVDMSELRPWLNSLEQPIISRAWNGLRCTHFHWEWPLTAISPAVVEVKLSAENMTGMRGGKHRFGQAHAKTSGSDLSKAYVMNVPWRLLLPFDPRILAKTENHTMARAAGHAAGAASRG